MMHTIKCLLTDYVCVMARDKQNKYSGICPNFECAGGEVHDGLAVQLQWLLGVVFHTARSL